MNVYIYIYIYIFIACMYICIYVIARSAFLDQEIRGEF